MIRTLLRICGLFVFTLLAMQVEAASGSVAFSASNYSVVQKWGAVSFTVKRVGGTTGAVSVHYGTKNGTALSSVEYVGIGGTLRWASGDAANKTFTVYIKNATPFSGTKAFTLALTYPSGGVTLGSPATATVTITGSAAASSAGSVGLSASTYAVAQNTGTVAVSVKRTGGSAGAASVRYATANGTAIASTDYTSQSGTLSWAAGDAASKTFSVPISKAKLFTGSKNFTVNVSNVTGAKLGTPTSASITINGSGQTTGGGGTSPAAALAAKLGRPSRLLVGVGGGAEVRDILNQGIRPDIYDRYLVGVGAGSWPTWNSPSGAYVGVVASAADSVGAVPMFTLYQMASIGDGNLAGLADTTWMTNYWANARLMFQKLGEYGKPALVNLEPDFWGYAQRQSGNDPTKLVARVTIAADCTTLTNDITGIAGCLVKMARKYAPKAYVGFPPATWGADSTAQLSAFMNKIGAANADFIVMQVSDRDSGCFEVVPQPSYCVRTGSPWYWDESNQTHPNFHDHFTLTQTYRSGVGNLPVLWWQTPFGAPSGTKGGTSKHYRDNRVHYFLTHPQELTAVGALGVVFGAGEVNQTNITTDGGQFQSLSSGYLANPTALP